MGCDVLSSRNIVWGFQFCLVCSRIYSQHVNGTCQSVICFYEVLISRRCLLGDLNSHCKLFVCLYCVSLTGARCRNLYMWCKEENIYFFRIWFRFYFAVSV